MNSFTTNTKKPFLKAVIAITVIVITTIIAASYLTQKVLIESKRSNAETITNIVHECRKLYSDEVVNRLKEFSDIEVSNRYRDHEHGIPNPATFTMLLGKRITDLKGKSGLMVRMYSDLPFRNRTNRTLDDFAKLAINHVKQPPITAYQSIEQQDGVDIIRYASPMIMSESCVACHKMHPDSPKRDWNVGDVRGVLEVTQPLQADSDGVNSAYLTRNLFFIIIAITILAAAIIMVRNRHEKSRVKQEVAHQTADLLEQSLTDELTGLGNRRYFNKKYDDAWRYCLRKKAPLSIALIDVDHFKKYNDEFGHPAGDSCLQKISFGIKEGLNRPLDVIARYGGEEFVVILVDTDLNGTEHAMENIRASIAKLAIPSSRNTESRYVSVSIGSITVNNIDTVTKESVIKQADKALYQAKAAGRNTNICLAYEKGE
jgi:diguanylate cyclase (GGDEF)-like protein